jgi:hypothetical protein
MPAAIVPAPGAPMKILSAEVVAAQYEHEAARSETETGELPDWGYAAAALLALVNAEPLYVNKEAERRQLSSQRTPLDH